MTSDDSKNPDSASAAEPTSSPHRDSAQVTPAPRTRASVSGLVWLILGISLVATFVVRVACSEEHYFTQDDNFAEFLPIILDGMKLLFSGTFPTFNPYQYLGFPVFEVGLHSLSYPGMWLSYGIATYVLTDPVLTIEVFCILHIAAGFLAAFWLARVMGLVPALACTFGLSYALCGYFFIVGRGWYYMVPVAVWVPVVFAALMKLATSDAPLRWAVVLGGAIGLFFHAGNAQMWAYNMVFLGFAVLVLLWTRKLSRARALVALAAVLLGLAVAAPLMVPQYLFASKLHRVGGLDGNISNGIPSLFLPHPVVVADPLAVGGSGSEFIGHAYYSGSVLMLLGLLGTLTGILSVPRKIMRLHRGGQQLNWPIALGVLAFLYGLGGNAPIWTISTKLPVFEKFNYPFKVVPFIVIFLCLGGALMFQRLMQHRSHFSKKCQLVFLLTLACLALHATRLDPTFCRYGDSPYPPTPDWLQKHQVSHNEHRVFSAIPRFWHNPNYVGFLQNNFGTLYQVPVVAGYEPLMETTTQFREVMARLPSISGAGFQPRNYPFARYGVRWITAVANQVGNGRAPLQLLVSEVPDPDPLAFELGHPAQPLEVDLSGGRVRVSLTPRPQERRIVLNFLSYPNTVVEVDGVAAEWESDEWGRIVCRVPSGGRLLDLSSAPPIAFAFGVMCALLALGGLCLFVSRRYRRG